jgi:PAS domain S-box-containing protein
MNKTPVILIVYDNAEILWSYSRLFESSGYHVLQASTGEECLRLVNENHPDLVLLDVVLPDANGIELCKRIKADTSLAGIFVALISARDVSSNNRAAGLEAGADEYIARPVDNRELLARAQALIRIKMAEEALRISEQQFRSLSACSPVGVFLTDTEGRCTYTNRRCQAIGGFTFDESLGDGWARFVHPEDRERVLNAWMEHTRRACEYSQEYRFVTRDGVVRHVQVRSAPMLSDLGELIGQVGTVEDVTDQKRVQEEIRFQANLLGTVEQAVIATDSSGRIIYWNWFAEKLYGWQSAEVIGRNIVDVTPSEASTEQALEIMSRLKAGESWSGQFRVRRRDGTVFPAMTTTTPIRNTKGELIGIVGVSIDISERIKFEEELRERGIALQHQNQFIQTITDNAASCLFMMDNHGYPTFMNPVAEAVTGYTLSEIKDKPLHYAIHHTHADGSPYPMSECPIDNASERLVAVREQEEIFVRKDGSFFPVSFSVAPLERDENSIGAVLEFRDITEQKRSEEALRFQAEASTLLASSLEYETTLASIARLAVPGLADWCAVDMLEDDRSIKRLVIAHVDPQKVALAYEVQHKYPSHPTLSAPMQEALRNGKPQLVPEVSESFLTAVSQDEQHLEILRGLSLKSWIIVPLVARARTLGALTFVSAESGRRYNNSDLALFEDLASRAAIAVDNAKLYRQAQEASRAKDEFLATVSHELRTPLNAIMGWAQILRRGHSDGQFLIRAIETIERNARAQAQIINDILDVSRIITGKLRLEVRPVEPSSIIQAAVETVRPAAEAKGIRIQMVLDSSAGPISGDPDRLQQVVWNLLSNAIKYAPKGERVQVRLERVDSHVEIIVSDTGKGINTELLPYVFERFRQDDSSTTRRYGGLGLGLAIVRHLVELHGGTVHAYSEGEGTGATFTIVLPLMLGQMKSSDYELAYPAQSDALSTHSLPALDSLRVLIVDDESDARVLLREMLAPCGAEVIACASAAEALTEIERQKPDIIVSDIGMPDEDGYMLIRKVRALTPEAGGKIPAIALTAYARSEDRIRALVAGYQVHVPKPVDLTELAIAVASLAGRTGKP